MVGAFAALFAVGMYLFARNREDKDGKRIHSAFMLGGLSGLISFLFLMGADARLVAWGIYFVLCIVIIINRK